MCPLREEERDCVDQSTHLSRPNSREQVPAHLRVDWIGNLLVRDFGPASWATRNDFIIAGPVANTPTNPPEFWRVWRFGFPLKERRERKGVKVQIIWKSIRK